MNARSTHMKTLVRSIVVFVIVLSLSLVVWAQNATFAPNENLVVEGVPPIPAALAETVEGYSNFRGAALAGWDPERHEMLISTRFADVPEIHLVKMPGGAR